jgi:hypothetical protein
MIPLSALNTIPVEQIQPGLLKVLLIPLVFAAVLILRNYVRRRWLPKSKGNLGRV